MSKEHSPLLENELNEKCGVFGMLSHHTNSSPYTMLGLLSLQHRGQEAAGITSSNGDKLSSHRGKGLVLQVFNEQFDFRNLSGEISIGHTRYGTSGGKEHLQPVAGATEKFALAHNGNIPDTTALEVFLDEKNIPNPDLNDSEMMHASVEYFLKKGAPLEEAIAKASPLFTGAWSLVMMDKEKLVAARDSKGIRPLSIGKGHDGYVFSSETCAFGPLNITHLRDVEPGEMVIVDQNGMRSVELSKGEQRLDVFEFVYFARPDSTLLGKAVDTVRRNMGKRLAQEMANWEKPIEADIVMGVPDSGLSAAYGFRDESGIPHEEGFVKNRYMGRTFINPEENAEGAKNNGRSIISRKENTRSQNVKMKLSALPSVVAGKRVIVIDDSIVRGNTYRTVGEILRDAGAREVHMVVSSPPVYYPDFYGIDTPKQSELFANQHASLKEMCLALSADSLHYLSYEGMIEATGLPEGKLSTSAFSGVYPADIGNRKDEVRKMGARA